MNSTEDLLFNLFCGDAVRAARPAVLIGGADVVDILFRLRRDGLAAVSYTHLDVYKRQSQTPALFRYIGTLLSNLRLLNSVNKFRPVISRIFSDRPECVLSLIHI